MLLPQRERSMSAADGAPSGGNRCGILAIRVADGSLHLMNAGLLLGTGATDLRHVARHAFGAGHDVGHAVAGRTRQRAADLNFVGRVVVQVLDFLRGAM